MLNAYNSHPKPGDTVTVTGRDLGVAGTVGLGGDTITPDSWSSTSFTFVIPENAKGSLPLTINCGKASNTVAVQMFQEPSNDFVATAGTAVRGGTATVKVKVPGPGAITVRGSRIKSASKHAGKAGIVTVKVSLTVAGRKSLRRTKTLRSTLSVAFTPSGGVTSRKNVKAIFHR